MGASPQGGVDTYYIDASVPKAVREAIASVRNDVLYAGGEDAPAENTLDDVWLPQAGAANWVVIHRDKWIKKRPGERQALLDNGVRTFCMTSAGNYTRWETLRLLADKWPGIEKTATKDAGPYICSVTWQGIRKLYLPGENG
jgi:hypothetical protein